MVDTRFHPFAGAAPLGRLLAAVGSGYAVVGDGPIIVGAEELDVAGIGHVGFAAHRRYAAALRATSASAVIVAAELREAVPEHCIAVIAEDPHLVFVGLLEQLYPDDTRHSAIGLAPGRAAAPRLEGDVHLGVGVALGDGVEIGRGTVIGANSVIGAGVTIGRNAVIGANCSVECAHLGNQVILHTGARIGTEGFGWLDWGRSNRKIPQLGRVILQDCVEIGANTTVDRGALGDTVIGEGTKIDNLVQIGHNCRIGRYCLVAAMSGFAGSTIVEDSVVCGAATGSAGHLTVGRGSVLAAGAAVTKNVPPGSRLAGVPAQEAGAWARDIAAIRRLRKRGESER